MLINQPYSLDNLNEFLLDLMKVLLLYEVRTKQNKEQHML